MKLNIQKNVVLNYYSGLMSQLNEKIANITWNVPYESKKNNNFKLNLFL